MNPPRFDPLEWTAVLANAAVRGCPTLEIELRDIVVLISSRVRHRIKPTIPVDYLLRLGAKRPRGELRCNLGTAVRAQHSQVASGQGREFGMLHCKLGHRVQIEPGLRPQSPKNGSFSHVRQRLSANPLRECPKSELGDWWLIRKNPPLAGLSANIRGPISRAGLAGWRRSADRTRLHANSLLTGNFKGNFAILVPQKPILLHETAVLQRLFDQFPTQINRKNISKNKGIFSR